MKRITQKQVGKYFKIYWRDPTTFIATSLSKVLKDPYSLHENCGKIVHVGQRLVVLQHDECGDEEGSGDFTSIDPYLIVKVEKI